MDEDDMENMTPEQIAQAQKQNCIFCKIISGEIPSKKVYEDADFLGILDINPATDGHVLLMPKQHFQIMPQLPPELVGKLGIACTSVSSSIIKSFKCEGTSVFIANGAVAGQRAPHFIVHIMPRADGDDILLNPQVGELDDDSFNSVQGKISVALGLKPKSMSKSAKPVVPKAPQKETKEKQEAPEKSAEESAEETEEESDDFKDETSATEEDSGDEDDTPEEDEEESTKKQTLNPRKKQEQQGSEKKGIDYDKLARLFK